jgi:hypothetical protein
MGGRATFTFRKGLLVRALFPPPTSHSHLEDAPRTGDICALLVPNYDQGSAIRGQLEVLRGQFGGTDVTPLHVLCQRFRADKAQLETLKPHFKSLVQQTSAIRIYGSSIEPFYSTFRARELLKCHIAPPEGLEKFVTALNGVLKEHETEPLDLALPEWVTLLEDIQVGRLQPHPYERQLFVGRRLLISELRAPGRFKALHSFAFATTEISSQKSVVRSQ